MPEDQATQTTHDQPQHMREALGPPVLESALVADPRQLPHGPAAQRGQALSRIGVEPGAAYTEHDTEHDPLTW